MHPGRVWIVATEQENSEPTENLECQLSCEVERISHRTTRRRDLPLGDPDLILFDLRGTLGWHQALSWAMQARSTELVSIPWVGVTGDYVPLDVAIEADQAFSCFVRGALGAEGLSRTLRLARKRLAARGYEKLCEHRSLVGANRKFRTYEPSLFSPIEHLEIA